MGGWVASPLAGAIAVLTTIAAISLSSFNIFKHAVYYTSPRTQKYIFRILGVVPVYALSSCISVLFTDSAVVILMLRDIYEAIVVYAFFTLILEYAGGDYNCIEQVKHLPPIRHPFPLCCLPHIRRDAYLLRLCKQGVVQFVVIKPIVAFLSLVALGAGFFFEDIFQFPILVVYNVTYTVALYCLLIFYLAIQTLLTLYKPVQKFFAVKAIVFATFWQSMVITLLPNLTVEDSIWWNNFLLCVECVPFAILLNRAFPYHDFITTNNDKKVSESVKQMMSVGDVFQDAYHSFMPSYQDYMVARDDHDKPKTIRAKTFLVGNLDSEAMKGTRDSEFQSNASRVNYDGQKGAKNAGNSMNPADNHGDGLEIDDMWSAGDVNIIELDKKGKYTPTVFHL